MSTEAQTQPLGSPWQARALLAMVLTIATAGLVYELGMAAVASYVLGDSVRQFSIVIGVYLSALGLGAYLSRFVEHDLSSAFIHVELATAMIGGLSAPGLFIAFSLGASFELLLLLVVTAVGTLVGIELPLLMRILERRLTFKDLVARALTYDYAGALLGSLGFSLYLLPNLGLIRSSILCGLLNALVGFGATWILTPACSNPTKARHQARAMALLVVLVLGAATYAAPRLVSASESRMLGKVAASIDTPYQRITLVQHDNARDLYLNGHLQFSSRDECRYHEALVHPVMAAATSTEKVFIGGGGDGLAVREVLRWSGVQSVTLVDLDPAMTELSRNDPHLQELNRRSLHDPRVHIENADAFHWIQHDPDTYNVVILDFPDPTTYGVGKLFTTTFYTRLKHLLAPGAAMVVQATSPLTSNQSYWTIEHTMTESGLYTTPMRVFLPSFGDWGFLIATSERRALHFESQRTPTLACLDAHRFNLLLDFPNDTRRVETTVNRLDNQALVHTYIAEAARFE